MICTQPKVSPEGLYESLETINALQISRQTLSRWSRSGLLPFSIRKSNGRRVYKGSDIIRCWRWVY